MAYGIGSILKINNVTAHGTDMITENMVGKKGIVIDISAYEGLTSSGYCYKLLFNDGSMKEALWRDVSLVGTLKDIL